MVTIKQLQTSIFGQKQKKLPSLASRRGAIPFNYAKYGDRAGDAKNIIASLRAINGEMRYATVQIPIYLKKLRDILGDEYFNCIDRELIQTGYFNASHLERLEGLLDSVKPGSDDPTEIYQRILSSIKRNDNDQISPLYYFPSGESGSISVEHPEMVEDSVEDKIVGGAVDPYADYKLWAERFNFTLPDDLAGLDRHLEGLDMLSKITYLRGNAPKTLFWRGNIKNYLDCQPANSLDGIVLYSGAGETMRILSLFGEIDRVLKWDGTFIILESGTTPSLYPGEKFIINTEDGRGWLMAHVLKSKLRFRPLHQGIKSFTRYAVDNCGWQEKYLFINSEVRGDSIGSYHQGEIENALKLNFTKDIICFKDGE